MSRKLTITEAKERIKKIHGDVVTLDESTYVNTYTKCRLVDKDYGEWFAIPLNIIYKKRAHPLRQKSARKGSKTLPIGVVQDRLQKIYNHRRINIC